MHALTPAPGGYLEKNQWDKATSLRFVTAICVRNFSVIMRSHYVMQSDVIAIVISSVVCETGSVSEAAILNLFLDRIARRAFAQKQKQYPPMFSEITPM